MLNSRPLKTSILCIAAAATLFMSGCAQVSKQANPEHLSVNLSGLTLDKSQAPATVYKRANAPTLADYRQFILDPLTIDYSDPNMEDISAEDVKLMQDYFQQVMTKALTDGGYELVTRSAPNVLRMTFSIKDMQAPTPVTNVSMLLVPGLSTSVGKVTIQAVFTDAESNQINTVVLESSRGSYMFNPNPLSTMSDVEMAFDNWAIGLRTALDKAHGKKETL